MDDGAVDINQSAHMLRSLYTQGIRRCVLTPHYYGSHESIDSFLKRRAHSYENLMAVYDEKEMPRLVLGAEVHITKNMSQHDLLPLCIGDSDIILMEFPYTDFQQWMVSEIEQVVYAQRLNPIIAHIDRVMESFSKEHLEDLLAFDEFIFQINNEAFADFFGRGQLYSTLGDGQLCVLGSDCHDMARRKPNFDITNKHLTDSKRSAALYESVIETSEALATKLFTE